MTERMSSLERELDRDATCLEPNIYMKLCNRSGSTPIVRHQMGLVPCRIALSSPIVPWSSLKKKYIEYNMMISFNLMTSKASLKG